MQGTLRPYAHYLLQRKSFYGDSSRAWKSSPDPEGTGTSDCRVRATGFAQYRAGNFIRQLSAQRADHRLSTACRLP
jgi:hypothetical protein